MPKKKTKKVATQSKAAQAIKVIQNYAKLYAFELPKDWGKIGKKGGRPTVMNEKTLRKLELGFAFDSTVEEACIFAGITPFTYYEFLKKCPKFSNTVELLRNIPTLMARHTIVTGVFSSQDSAMNYMTKKRRGEFGAKLEIAADVKTTHEVDDETKEQINNVFGLFEAVAKKVAPEYENQELGGTGNKDSDGGGLEGEDDQL